MRKSAGKVVVAMSGGVDSSVAACLLHEQGYEVIGLFMRTGVEEPQEADAEAACTLNAVGGDEPAHRGRPERPRGCCSASDAADARRVAGQLGVPFFALNFRRQFDRIIAYFAAEYLRGRTPNPCVMCNEQLKFGRLVEYGRAVGADFIATGHYARIRETAGQWQLLRAVDRTKDQSYVLFGIGRENLPRTLFPVGELTKEQVRAHARRFGLPVHDKVESQDICFVPDGDYARVVRQRHPEAFVEGPIVDTQGRLLGRHGGIAHYTIGQRRGLGVALGRPAYVVRIDPRDQSVTLGDKEDLFSSGLTAGSVRWLIDPPATSFRAEVQIRYSHRAAAATVERLGPEIIRVRFDTPQAAVTPGQATVLYDGDRVLAGGWIEQALSEA